LRPAIFKPKVLLFSRDLFSQNPTIAWQPDDPQDLTLQKTTCEYADETRI
jgi:hypothetical protein